MDEIYARLSKAGRILCGRPDPDGRFTCDEPVADWVEVTIHTGFAERRLVPLDGWVLDKKGIWTRTTRVEDLRRHGIVPARARVPAGGRYPDLPALVRCPKCSAVQWLEPARLRVSPRPNRPAPESRTTRRW